MEFFSGIIFASLFWKLQNIFFFSTFIFTISYAYYATLFALLLVIAVYDTKHKIIPDMLVIFFNSLAFIGIFLFSKYTFYPHLPGLWEFLSGPIIAAPFAFFWLISGGRWMGLGDAKLAVGLGWILGLSAALSGLVLAFWSGTIVGIMLIISSKRYGMKSEIPFAPYLALGAFLAFIFQFNFFMF